MKKGFTLIELIAVISILCATIILIVVKVENKLDETAEFEKNSLVELIESSAILYLEDNTISDLENYDVATITVNDLVTSGIVKEQSVLNVDLDNLILIAYINDAVKVKYLDSTTTRPVIFLVGSALVSVTDYSSYTDPGAEVAVCNDGIHHINGTSNYSSSTGEAIINYTYSGADQISRTVKEIN